MKKKLLIIRFSSLRNNKRVFRQINYLKNEYDVYTAGFNDSKIEGVKYCQIEPIFNNYSFIEKLIVSIMILFNRYEKVYYKLYDFTKAFSDLSNIKFDLIIVHDLKPLPFIYKIWGNSNIIFDAHEYYYNTNAFSLINYFMIDKLERYYLKNYFLKQKKVITVNNGIANLYKQKLKSEIYIIPNTAVYHKIEPSPVNPDKIKIIHHGMADNNRKIELMIELMDYVDDRFELDIMLITKKFQERYLSKLKRKCKRKKNVRIIEPIDSDKIIEFSNKYDIGLYLLPNNVINHKLSLPNKFFEYIQSRLMIAIGPNKEMAEYVNKYNLGILSDDYKPQTMAKLLNNLNEEKITYYKAQSNKYALELSDTEQKNVFLDIVKNSIE